MPRRSAIELTDVFVRRARAGANGRAEYTDRLAPGLELRVSRGGDKSWSYRYRNGAGRCMRLSLGDYPAVSIKAARLRAVEARAAVGDGRDPHTERILARAQARHQVVRTIGDLAAVFLAFGEKNFRPATVNADRNRLDLYVLPRWKALPVEGLTRAHVRELLAEMKDAPVQANRTAALIGRLFNHAAKRLDMKIDNPALGLQSTYVEVSRERRLSDSELKMFFEALDAPPNGATLSPAMADCLRLCALTLQRANEVAGLNEAELSLDEAVWIIPAARMKNGVEHVVPLPEPALEIIRRRLQARPKDKDTGEPATPLLFPSPRDLTKAITRHAITRAMTRLCQILVEQQRLEQKRAGAKKSSGALLEDASPHDLRRTGATAITSERIGMSRFTVSLVLGHRSETGGVTSIYDRNAYLSEKRQALTRWAELLPRLSLKNQIPPIEDVRMEPRQIEARSYFAPLGGAR